MTKRQTLVVKLRRPNKKQPWGISIAGGADLGTPIIVTRVSFLLFSFFFLQKAGISDVPILNSGLWYF